MSAQNHHRPKNVLSQNTIKHTPGLGHGAQNEWIQTMKRIAITVCVSMILILVACQASSTGTSTSAMAPTPSLLPNTPFPTSTMWITPKVTATPIYLSFSDTGDKLESMIGRMYYELCVGQNEVGLSDDWNSSSLKFIETDIQPDLNKYWVSEIANNLDNSLEAFVACEPNSCSNQIYIKNNKTGEVFEVDWKLKDSWLPIQKVTWINYDTFMFFQSPDSTHGQIVAINFDKKEYRYSATAYPKSNCPIATPTLTPLPSYPLKQILFNYTITGFHTPYDMYFTDYDWSHFVLYTDGQLVIPGTPYKQKMLSKDEVNQFLARLETLGFYTIESNQSHDPTDKLYNFGDQYQEVNDGLWYCISAYGDKPRSLCAYEPFIELVIPEMKSLLQFLDKYQQEEMLPYYPDRILLWVQAGRSPYSTDLPKDSIPWTESSFSLETTTEKVIYADGEIARNLYLLYGDKQYVFTENGKEYTVGIQVILPHKELTNKYQ